MPTAQMMIIVTMIMPHAKQCLSGISGAPFAETHLF